MRVKPPFDTHYLMAILLAAIVSTGSALAQSQDEYEDDDFASSAKTISKSGSVQQHTFHNGLDKDFVKFAARAGTVYRLSINSTVAVRINLVTRSGASTGVSFDAPGDSPRNFILPAQASTGWVYIQFERRYLFSNIPSWDRYPTNQSGEYAISIRATSVVTATGDSYEPDNSRTATAATPLIPGSTSQSHTILPAGDEDWFRVSATAGNSYVVETTGTTDTNMRLYNSSGTLLAENDDGPTSRNARIAWTATSTGNYYLQVVHFNTAQTGAYRISVIETAPVLSGDRYEPDNTFDQATSISLSTTEAHTISPAGDVDLWRLTVSSRYRYTVETSGTMDLHISTLNIDNGETLNDNDGGNARIEFTPPSTTLLLIAVKAISATAVGSYTINVTRELVPTFDVNGDGAVDISDVIAILEIVSGSRSTTTLADVDASGTVDVDDALLVLRRLASSKPVSTAPIAAVFDGEKRSSDRWIGHVALSDVAPGVALVQFRVTYDVDEVDVTDWRLEGGVVADFLRVEDRGGSADVVAVVHGSGTDRQFAFEVKRKAGVRRRPMLQVENLSLLDQSFSMSHGAEFVLSPLDALSVEAGFPNPFNSATSIGFSLDEPGDVLVSVYNVAGQLVRTISDESLSAGRHVAHWDGLMTGGIPAGSGVYFFELRFRSGGLVTRRVAHVSLIK